MAGFEGNSLLGLISRLRGAFYAKTDPIVRTLYVATADKTVGNTTTETSIIGTGVGSLTPQPAAVSTPPTGVLPFWVIGKTVRVRVMGRLSQLVAGPNHTVKIYLGATALGTIGPYATASALTNTGFSYEFLITCRTTGATGTVYTQGFTLNTTLGQNHMGATSTVTIDTTASSALDVKFTWGTADAGNTITATHTIVEALN